MYVLKIDIQVRMRNWTVLWDGASESTRDPRTFYCFRRAGRNRRSQILFIFPGNRQMWRSWGHGLQEVSIQLHRLVAGRYVCMRQIVWVHNCDVGRICVVVEWSW